MSSHAETIASLHQRLTALAPLQLDIEDDSHRHAGHAGARDGGGHFNLSIVTAAFSGKNTIARHRLIYDAVGDLMHCKIHALTICAKAPEEV